MRFSDIFAALFALYSSPTGTYCGSKTVFGETINGQVRFKSSELLDFAISGDFTINCADEYYVLDGSQIILRDIGVVGDCTHDALTDNKIMLDSITYDSSANQINVAVKYSIAKIDILLSSCNSELSYI
jgi:hypothetical protein